MAGNKEFACGRHPGRQNIINIINQSIFLEKVLIVPRFLPIVVQNVQFRWMSR